MARTPDQIVAAEVHYCVSYLVSTLAATDASGIDSKRNSDMVDMIAQAYDLACPLVDWEESALQAGWVVVDRDPSEDRQEEGPCLYHAEQDRALPLGTWQGACEDLGLEMGDGLTEREVFEHWIVSDWLADQLIAKGEKVDKDFAGMIVWARTTSGQGIASDSVIEAIAAEMNAAYPG